MANKKIRIVLDTNIWVSYLISKKHIRIDKLLRSETVELVFSEELLLEFIEVTDRPKLRKYFKQEDITDLLDSMNEVGTIVKLTSKVNKCRDEKDNFLLALCKDGKVDYLVSGDEDLLTLEEFGKTKIIKYSELNKEIK